MIDDIPGTLTPPKDMHWSRAVGLEVVSFYLGDHHGLKAVPLNVKRRYRGPLWHFTSVKPV